MTAVVAVLLLGLQQRGHRGFEIAITVCLAIIVAAFAWNLTVVDIVPQDLVSGLVPRLTDAGSVLLAVGIVGATVMPHVVYLHSSLVTERIPTSDPAEVRALLHYTRLDVILSMLIAGATNIAMLVVAAAAFSGATGVTVASLDDAFVASGTVLGSAAARRSPSRCWRPASRARASGRWPARWSCRGSSTDGSRSGSGGS